MYTLLLADDEPLVLESMKKIIGAGFTNVQKLLMAKTGREAVQLAMQHSPDIVIMDILMPGINGLDAIRVLKQWRIDIVFVVISAYEHFNYAHEALELGVTDYLLKPVGKDAIIDVVGKAMKKSAESREKADRELKYLEHMEQLSTLLEYQFLTGILMGASGGEIEVYAKLLDVEVRYGAVLVLELLETRLALEEAEAALDALRERAKSLVSNCIAARTRLSRLVVFIPLERDEHAKAIVEGFPNRLVQDIHIDKIRIGVGETHLGYSGILESYNEAASRLRQCAEAIDEYDAEYPSEQEKKLLDALQCGDGLHALALASQLTEWFRAQNMDFEYVKRGMSRIVALLLEVSSRFTEGRYSDIEIYNSFFELENYFDMTKWLESYIKRTVSSAEAEKEGRVEDVFHKAKEYIECNYNLDINLESVAKHINMSATYFSSLFHRIEGTSFINYLTDVRVKKAKELIYQRKYSVKEISRMVGYRNPNYFSRVFKRVTETSPTALLEKLVNDSSEEPM